MANHRNPLRTRRAACRLLAPAPALASAAAHAQDAFPARTVQVVIPYTPGSGVDVKPD